MYVCEYICVCMYVYVCTSLVCVCIHVRFYMCIPVSMPTLCIRVPFMTLITSDSDEWHTLPKTEFYAYNAGNRPSKLVRKFGGREAWGPVSKGSVGIPRSVPTSVMKTHRTTETFLTTLHSVMTFTVWTNMFSNLSGQKGEGEEGRKSLTLNWLLVTSSLCLISFGGEECEERGQVGHGRKRRRCGWWEINLAWIDWWNVHQRSPSVSSSP